MPSPFPGMDPYLEDPALFPGLHQFLIIGLAAKLNSLLPRCYAAAVQERLYIERNDRSIYPDTSVIEQSESRSKPRKKAKAAVVLAADPAWEVDGDPAETREWFIEIVAAGDRSRVIAAIEILSPGNKARGSDGREQYEKKQREVLASDTHFIEIDLLRDGDHTIAAPHGKMVRRGHYDYLVCLSRGDQHGRYTVWARTVRDRLPRFLVPLADQDPGVTVDLQPILDQAYDDGAFERRVDYATPPSIPLSPADAKWADGVLRKRSVRR